MPALPEVRRVAQLDGQAPVTGLLGAGAGGPLRRAGAVAARQVATREQHVGHTVTGGVGDRPAAQDAVGLALCQLAHHRGIRTGGDAQGRGRRPG